MAGLPAFGRVRHRSVLNLGWSCYRRQASEAPDSVRAPGLESGQRWIIMTQRQSPSLRRAWHCGNGAQTPLVWRKHLQSSPGLARWSARTASDTEYEAIVCGSSAAKRSMSSGSTSMGSKPSLAFVTDCAQAHCFPFHVWRHRPSPGPEPALRSAAYTILHPMSAHAQCRTLSAA